MLVKKYKYNYLVTIIVGVICLVVGMCASSLIIHNSQDYNDMVIRMTAMENEMQSLSGRLDDIEKSKVTVEQNVEEKATANESEKEASAAVATQGETVWKTKSGKKYHKENCGSLSKSSIAVSLEEAKAAGLEPCKRCFK